MDYHFSNLEKRLNKNGTHSLFMKTDHLRMIDSPFALSRESYSENSKIWLPFCLSKGVISGDFQNMNPFLLIPECSGSIFCESRGPPHWRCGHYGMHPCARSLSFMEVRRCAWGLGYFNTNIQLWYLYLFPSKGHFQVSSNVIVLLWKPAHRTGGAPFWRMISSTILEPAHRTGGAAIMA